ncbi:MAG: chorismate synthase [Desulfitobacteriaceae bacterium]|nr:chorismate synthase [Desulfitobacteriaceae bacterium]
MGMTWGKNIKLSIFGESHGKAIGIIVDGLPPGMELNLDLISEELNRRAPGKNDFSTTRKESEKFEILSGFFAGRTTGTPLAAVIYNENQQSREYEKIRHLIRPGHADYPGYVKYQGFNDYRGGGHFSGRLTAPLVFAGACAKQLLLEENIWVASYIKSIGEIEERDIDLAYPDSELLLHVRKKEFPAIFAETAEMMKGAIQKAREDQDSVGGVVETVVGNVPPGIGDPFFNSMESSLAQIIFSIPGVKGLEFGSGFDVTRMKGSQANDCYYLKKNEIKTRSNHNGGILGGITNGMPLVFRTAFKPTASIGKAQSTVNLEKMSETVLQIKGRHDPCIVPRAVPVVEAAAALVLLDLIIDNR